MMLCDFHIHSTFSDGRLTIPEIVDLYGKRGFGAIAITDHLCEEDSFLGKAAQILDRTLTRQSFPQYLELIKAEAERAYRQYRMVLIPGMELTKNSIVNARSAHIVVLGAEQFISADQEIHQMLRGIRDQGAISIAAHPVSTQRFEPQTYFLWSRREELATAFDAWEVASGPVLFDEVVKTNLPKIASSDLHHPRQISSWKTVLRCERHQEAIFDAIRSQQVEFQFFQDRVVAPSRYVLQTA
jgi:PHP family Zn ribbon phosphoesterase